MTPLQLAFRSALLLLLLVLSSCALGEKSKYEKHLNAIVYPSRIEPDTRTPVDPTLDIEGVPKEAQCGPITCFDVETLIHDLAEYSCEEIKEHCPDLVAQYGANPNQCSRLGDCSEAAELIRHLSGTPACSSFTICGPPILDG